MTLRSSTSVIGFSENPKFVAHVMRVKPISDTNRIEAFHQDVGRLDRVTCSSHISTGMYSTQQYECDGWFIVHMWQTLLFVKPMKGNEILPYSSHGQFRYSEK